jgi:hypothetical protein
MTQSPKEKIPPAIDRVILSIAGRILSSDLSSDPQIYGSEINPNQMIPDEDLATLRFSPRIFTKTFLGGLALYRSIKGSSDLFSSY